MRTDIGPVTAGNRHVSLDVLRGIAVLGILMVNVQAFAMYYGTLSWPPGHMDMTGANQTVWLATHVFFEMKFITIFSALFGAGIMMMAGEADSASLKLHYRRMIWLLIIGLLHGFVLWFGDILAIYALIGMLVVLMRKMSPVKLIGWGLVGITLTGALLILQLFALNLSPDAAKPQPFQFIPTEESLETWINAYQAGFADSRLYNAIGYAIALLSGLVLFGGRLIGVMMIGMALFKLGFFQARWSARSYALAAFVSLGAGLPLVGWGGFHAMEAAFDPAQLWIHSLTNYIGSLLMAFGYASLVMLACKTPWLKLARAPFAAAGRMAFTNYLTQTLVMTFIFVGTPGLGLFGQMERTEQAMLVIAVWVAQLAVSMLWLQVFRFGPFEWLWRSLSYKKLQPFMRSRDAAA